MRFLTFVLILFSSVVSFAGTKEELLKQASDAYAREDYLLSVSLYQKVLKDYGANSELYYDLGNVYVKLENYGSAVLNYRRALKIKPSNRNAANNLAYVEQLVSLENEGKVLSTNLDPTPKNKSLMESVWDMAHKPGSNALAWIAASFFIIACGGMALVAFATSSKWKKIGFGMTCSLIVSIVCFIVSISAKSAVKEVTECVLILPEASLKEQPDAGAKDVGVPLTGGTTFRLIKESRDKDSTRWVNVMLNDDFTGWLPGDAVELVEV